MITKLLYHKAKKSQANAWFYWIFITHCQLTSGKLGGIVGGGVDYFSTKAIASKAYNLFIKEKSL